MGAGWFHLTTSVALPLLGPSLVHDEVDHLEEEEGGECWWTLCWHSCKWTTLRSMWDSHVPSSTTLVSSSSFFFSAASGPRQLAPVGHRLEVSSRMHNNPNNHEAFIDL